MRLIYFGTPAVAVPPLDALAGEHEIVLVVTQPDRKRGRGGALVASPVKQRAIELGLPVATPERASDLTDEITALEPDVAVVVAFGQLIKPELLAVPTYGFVNVHYSLLPRWRGAAPVERAVMAGDTETGVCIMAMDEGLDTGGVYARSVVPIGATDTAGDVFAHLEPIGVDLLVGVLQRIEELEPVPQVGDPTYATKLDPSEFVLDWSRPAIELDRIIRAGNPRPGAVTTVDGKRLKVWQAHLHVASADAAAAVEPGTMRGPVVYTGEGSLTLEVVQPEGKPRMSFDAWIAGRRGPTRLGA